MGGTVLLLLMRNVARRGSAAGFGLLAWRGGYWVLGGGYRLRTLNLNSQLETHGKVVER